MSESTKILVISDVHGRLRDLRWVLQNETAAAMFDGVKMGSERLAECAGERGADVALFGHTHRRELVRGVGTAATVFNPGSLRDGGSYGVITIENGKCSFTWKRVPEF